MNEYYEISPPDLHVFLRAFVVSGLPTTVLAEATSATLEEVGEWLDGSPVEQASLDAAYALAFLRFTDACDELRLAIVDQPRVVHETSVANLARTLAELRYLLFGPRFAEGLGLQPWRDAPQMPQKVRFHRTNSDYAAYVRALFKTDAADV